MLQRFLTIGLVIAHYYQVEKINYFEIEQEGEVYKGALR